MKTHFIAFTAMSRRRCASSKWIFPFPCLIWDPAATIGCVNDPTDSQLLRAYAEHRYEPAFADVGGDVRSL